MRCRAVRHLGGAGLDVTDGRASLDGLAVVERWTTLWCPASHWFGVDGDAQQDGGYCGGESAGRDSQVEPLPTLGGCSGGQIMSDSGRAAWTPQE